MNTIKEIQNINEQELQRGIAGTSASWHQKYAKSAWVYVGNLDHSLTEGDVICVLSQFGEVEDLHLVRDEDTGKSKGFAFCKYEDARSCALAVDNFCGSEVCGRSLRIDHVENYRLPKHLMEQEEVVDAAVQGSGHAYKDQELANEFTMSKGQDLFAPVQQEKAKSTKSHGSGSSKDKEDKRQRKEERHQKRQEKDDRKREREKKRMKKEEHKREKRARKMRDGDEEEGLDQGKQRSRNHKRHRSRSDSSPSAPDRS